MKDRIKQYMDYKGISAGELAVLLEVQRSNISHVLNGRNMPGASFIEKLLLNFPDLNARWLLTGVGEMTMVIEGSVANETATASESIVSQNVLQNRNKNKEVSLDRPISKVLLLYSDGTFADFEKK
ncbi:MAG TPA: helix-turn-helix transcriptional regulator [Draconibacterium sp.]|nr:helix-turn-helix transcriptional regulator [Draconibacterium sp.]